MTTAIEGITTGIFRQQRLQITRDNLHAFTYRRLTEVFESAKQVPFDDSSRFIFFSDCHRGNNNRIDAFARNEELFLRVLTHYYDEGVI